MLTVRANKTGRNESTDATGPKLVHKSKAVMMVQAGMGALLQGLLDRACR